MTKRADFINQQLLLIDGHYAGLGSKKHQKMRQSPFVFYRGSAQIFYADLAQQNLAMPDAFNNTLLTTVMGDCHTSNFGFFSEQTSLGENIVFAPNDFDDACIGYAYWDLMRFLVSLELARDHGHGLHSGEYSVDNNKAKNYSEKEVVPQSIVADAMHSFLSEYRRTLERGVSQKKQYLLDNDKPRCFLEDSFADFVTPSAVSKRYKKARSVALGGELFWTKSALAKAVNVDHLPLRFIDNPSKFSREGFNKDDLLHRLRPYFFQYIHDIVKRVGSGTGSVNMERYYLLIGPRNVSTKDDIVQCHVIEVKQQRSAAAIHYFPDIHHQNSLNPAHLTVKCQRRMQRKADYCLDDAFFHDSHWLIRSRHHAKVGIDPEHISLGKVNAHQGGFEFYASACGQALALAHCRGDKNSLNFELSMLTALDKEHFALNDTDKRPLVNIAKQYAKQVKLDWQWFCKQQ